MSPRPSSVKLMVTCMVDALDPDVAQAVVDLLSGLGVSVEVPSGQTCCGQPAFNAGFWDEARAMARRTLDVFGDDDTPVIVPSGSCGAMVTHCYPVLFEDDPLDGPRALRLAGRVIEFSQFLVERLEVIDLGARFGGRAAYHSSCHLSREMGVREPPRALLGAVRGLSLVEQANPEMCCGFGGAFAVKMPDISGAMLAAKLDSLEASGAEVIVGCDVSCLTHIQGGLQRRGSRIRCLHLARFLAEQKA